MKTTAATILAIVLLAVGANFLCDGCNGTSVTKAYFEERITDVEDKVDSLTSAVRIIDGKINILQKDLEYTKGNTDSTKSEVRVNGQKLDEIKTELDEVKSTTQNIQFRLF